MEREKMIEAWLRHRVEERGGVCMKFISPGNDGVPDRVVIMPEGRVYFVELKTNAGKLSKIQWFQLKRMLNLGHTCSVIFGMDAAKEYLRDLDADRVGVWYGAHWEDMITP